MYRCVRSVIKQQFASQSFIFCEASNGEEALLRAVECMPDLIIMDIRMPIMDGKAATKRLRLDTRFDNIPIIAFTASINEADGLKVLDEGFNAYIRKPATKGEFTSIFMRFLKYDEIIENNNAIQNESEESYDNLEQTLIIVQKAESAYLKCVKNGDFETIAVFIDLLKDATHLQEFINSMKRAIDALDVEEIEKGLANYPKLVEKLKNILLDHQ